MRSSVHAWEEEIEERGPSEVTFGGARTMSVTAATAMIAMMILGDRLRRMGAESLRGFTLGEGGRSGGPISCAQSVVSVRFCHSNHHPGPVGTPLSWSLMRPNMLFLRADA